MNKPVSRAQSAEDYDIDRWIEQQSEEEEYEKMKKQKQIDTIMVQAKQEVQI